VITDAKMPGFDGFLLTDQIKLFSPRLKVIMLTAHSYPSMTDKYTILKKPVNSEVLERMILS